MLSILWMALDWLPVILQAPLTALIAGLLLMVCIKLVSTFLSVLSAILSFITSWF